MVKDSSVSIMLIGGPCHKQHIIFSSDKFVPNVYKVEEDGEIHTYYLKWTNYGVFYVLNTLKQSEFLQLIEVD